MDSSWAQVWVQVAAIVFASAAAIGVPFLLRKADREKANRGRLNITTTRFAPSGLTLAIAYAPEFSHIGIRARVTLRSPRGLVLQGSKRVFNPGMMGSGYYLDQAAGLFIGGSGPLALLDTGDGVFTGTLWIKPESGERPPIPGDVIGKARITVEILTAANERLLKTELMIGAVDDMDLS